jgi:hypothetical protein
MFALCTNAKRETRVDWAKAIERNCEALAAIVAALFAMLRLESETAAARIPRGLHSQVLRQLRPAESALRRLIAIAARGLVVKLRPARAKPADRVIPKGTGSRPPAFQLFDPRKRFILAPVRRRSSAPRSHPRVWSVGPDPRVAAFPMFRAPDPPPAKAPAPPPDDGLIDARRIARRLLALKLALADIPRQAMRLARARARRAKIPRLQLQSPLRPGRPPGHRKVPVEDVDHLLAECHSLASEALRYDTS